ncbi:MAG: type II toxin-antitoxin system HicB family antitoxin [Firmicutes bacterium]|nr:type II toxin-antitoxin system HicB family antitoxin [Bacillota bacterium]
MLFDKIPEVEPDAEDIKMISKIKSRKDRDYKTLEDIEFNGKILVRVPKTLHKDLIVQAQHEGVSLNQLIVYKLAGQ